MRKFPKRSLKKGIFRPKNTQKREKSFFFCDFLKKSLEKICQLKKLPYLCKRFRNTTNKRKQSGNDSVAQLVEQMTLNHWVEGSSPSGVTKKSQTYVCDFFIYKHAKDYFGGQ